MKYDVLKDDHFEMVADARLDTKHRLTLGKIVGNRVTSVTVYRNAHGQLVLDPMVSVPAHEAWLFQNKRALSLLQKGTEDAKRGRLVKAKEDYSKYANDPEY